MEKQRNPEYYITQSVSTSVPPAPGKNTKGEIDYIPNTSKTDSERFKLWFIDPLMRMQQHDGFILMIALFPLYERHLRIETQMSKEEKFSENHRVFIKIGKDLSIPIKKAEEFWYIFRNGLLHWAQPDTGFVFQYRKDIPVYIVNDSFWVNPLSMRNHLLPKINTKPIWRHLKLPKIYNPMES